MWKHCSGEKVFRLLYFITVLLFLAFSSLFFSSCKLIKCNFLLNQTFKISSTLTLTLLFLLALPFCFLFQLKHIHVNDWLTYWPMCLRLTTNLQLHLSKYKSAFFFMCFSNLLIIHWLSLFCVSWIGYVYYAQGNIMVLAESLAGCFRELSWEQNTFNQE